MNDKLNDIDVLDAEDNEENIADVDLTEIQIEDSMPPELKNAISKFNSYVSNRNESDNNEVFLNDIDDESSDDLESINEIDSDIEENDVAINMDDIF